MYNLNPKDVILQHGRNKSARLVNDWGVMNSPSEVKALVASGDCFVTLATTIDEIAQSLTVDKDKATPQLEKLTAILVYLQRHYKITGKTADHRQ